MIIASVEGWVEAPLARYVEESRAQMALLLHRSGQVIAQAGFTRAIEVMSASALAAAVYATSEELGRQLGGERMNEVHHTGARRQFHLAPVGTGRTAYICLTVFDAESSLGLVRIYFADLCRELLAASPAPAPAPAIGLDFERDLHRNLTALFGRA